MNSENKSSPDSTKKFSSEEAKNDRVIRQFLKEVLNERNVDKLNEFITPDSIYTLMSKPIFYSNEETNLSSFSNIVKKDVSSFETSFPDMSITVNDVIPSGDRLVYIQTMKGTQSGPIGSIPAKGKKIELKCMAIYRMENSRIAQVWEFFDALGFLRQLDAIEDTYSAS